MSMQYTGYIQSFGNAGFIAGVSELKGMVEQANSPEGAMEKLMLAIRIREAYIKRIPLDSITIIANPIEKGTQKQSRIAEKEVSLVLQS